MKQVVAVLIGRPNVGKSTIFNALVAEERAIVSPEPGTTRDWQEGVVGIGSARIHLVDTGGYGMKGDLGKSVDRIVASVMKRASVIAPVVEAGVADSDEDLRMAEAVRRLGLPSVVICNKCDRESDDDLSWEHARLGLGSPVPISALKHRNLGELAAALAAAALSGEEGEPSEEDAGSMARDSRVVIMGRPNVGKSSLFNRLSGDERSLVHDQPGTTRDPVLTTAQFAGKSWEMVDTAGVGRGWKWEGGAQGSAQAMSLKAVHKADVVVLVLDLGEPLGRQDLRLASEAVEKGAALAVMLNKADLVPTVRLPEEKRKAAEFLHERFAELGRFPVIVGSALSGEGCRALGEAVSQLSRRRVLQFAPGLLVESSFDWPTPGNAWKVVQTGVSPPEFTVSSPVRSPDPRFVRNRLREALRLHGIPLRIKWFRGPEGGAGRANAGGRTRSGRMGGGPPRSGGRKGRQ